MNKPITLIGFMGSGKSTVGSQFAGGRNLEFIDLDKYISDSIEKSIPMIFSEAGEDGFRKIETACLSEVLTGTNKVIALGGGTPCFNNNMEIIKGLSTSVYLKVSPETLTNRLVKSKNPRPLIEGMSEDELLNYIRIKLREREEYYLLADHVIESDHIMTDDLLGLIFV